MDEPTAADDVTNQAEVEDGAVEAPGRRRRSVRWIITTVLVSVVLIAGLGIWVAAGSYAVKVDGVTVDCSALITWGRGPAAEAENSAFEKACDHQRDKRRTTALLFGVAIATVAAAVSTVPSRRLTGEALGPPA